MADACPTSHGCNIHIYMLLYSDMYGYIIIYSDQQSPGLSTWPGWGAVFGLSMALGGCCFGAGLMATSQTQAPGKPLGLGLTKKNRRISQSNICSLVHKP